MKSLNCILVALSVLMLASCEPWREQADFPRKIDFSAEGGEQVIAGDRQFTYIEIDNYDGEGNSGQESESGEITCQYEWLTVECVHGGNTLKITALPNESGSQRKLYIYAHSGPNYVSIKVKQD